MTNTEKNPKHLSFFRKKYLIYPGAQLSIVGYLVVIFWIVMGILYFGLTKTINAIDLEGIHQASAAQMDLMNQLHETRIATLQAYILGFVFFASIIMLAGGIFLSHRIVGPIYRIQMIFEQWSRGEKPTPLRVRDQDFFQELFPVLEKIVDKYFKN